MIPAFRFKMFHNIPIPELQKVYLFSCHQQLAFNPAGRLSIVCDPLVGKFWGLCHKPSLRILFKAVWQSLFQTGVTEAKKNRTFYAAYGLGQLEDLITKQRKQLLLFPEYKCCLSNCHMFKLTSVPVKKIPWCLEK